MKKETTFSLFVPNPSNSILPFVFHIAGLEGWQIVVPEKDVWRDLEGAFPVLEMNAVVASRGKHPFLKKFKEVDDLPDGFVPDLALMSEEDAVWKSEESFGLDFDPDWFEEGLDQDKYREKARVTAILLTGAESLSSVLPEPIDPSDRVVAIRVQRDRVGIIGIELTRQQDTTPETMELAEKLFAKMNVPTSVVNYDCEGGAALRVLVPLFTEAWRLFRELGLHPALIDLLSREMLGLDEGILSRIHREGSMGWGGQVKHLNRETRGDSRFQPITDSFPYDGSYGIWDTLLQEPPMVEGPEPETLPQRVLIVGVPHLVDMWRERLYQASNGRVDADAWRIWDLAAVEENELKQIAERGPYDLVMEVLIGPSEDRQQLLATLTQHVKEQGQVWVQTLNLPSTMVVSVVPVDLCAIGFSGIPSQGERPIIELSRPRNSDGSDLLRAAGLARKMGLEPFEVADEPGGVGPRLLAVLVNATSFLVREGILSSEAEADRLVKRALGMETSPFIIADKVGLDSIEGALIGLMVFLGESRYRVCPHVTLRIESGSLGHITKSGFYV